MNAFFLKDYAYKHLEQLWRWISHTWSTGCWFETGRRRDDPGRVVEYVGELMLPGEAEAVEQQRQPGSTAAVDAPQQGDVLPRRRARFALHQLGVEPADGAVLDEVGEQRRVTRQQLDRFTPSRQ